MKVRYQILSNFKYIYSTKNTVLNKSFHTTAQSFFNNRQKASLRRQGFSRSAPTSLQEKFHALSIPEQFLNVL